MSKLISDEKILEAINYEPSPIEPADIQDGKRVAKAQQKSSDREWMEELRRIGMRILGFSKKWDKLRQDEFTTFRFPGKDKDWQVSEVVQIVYKPRRKGGGEKLGIAHINLRETMAIRDISEFEAVWDGFESALDMWLWLKKPEMNKLINKLTLRWINASRV